MQDSALQCTAVQCNTVQYIRAVNLSGQQCEESGSGGEHHLLHHCILHCTLLYCTALHCSQLHCTALHCTKLQCTVAQYCTPEYIAGVIIAPLPPALSPRRNGPEKIRFSPHPELLRKDLYVFPLSKHSLSLGTFEQPNYGIIRVLDTTQIF